MISCSRSRDCDKKNSKVNDIALVFRNEEHELVLHRDKAEVNEVDNGEANHEGANNRNRKDATIYRTRNQRRRI